MNQVLSIEDALAALEEVAPEAPFLALGQTVFWDEPMKGGLALASKRLGYKRRFVAGVHDTDYFAKLPTGKREVGKFKALAHNDASTKSLWSAAAEFSALFGSETVITRDILLQGGLNLRKVLADRPGLLEEATEAWGWRGIVSLDEHPPITAHLPLRPLWSELMGTFLWALETTLESLGGGAREQAEKTLEDFRQLVCDTREEGLPLTLGEFYKRLIPAFYNRCANREVPVEPTATTELLRFNQETCGLPRFDLVRLFLDPASSSQACDAYNSALEGSEIYGLDRFGSGALPFDLVIPGVGRGTLRVAPRAIVVMTPIPQFISLKRPIHTLQDLALAIENKWGAHCVLIGKAVSLIGMLAREFVFVFHEGASSYVRLSRLFHQRLAEAGFGATYHPILRLRYNAWDALQVCCSWLRLPEPFQAAFGTEETCSPTFSVRWREVVSEQETILQKLGELRSPIELVRYLAQKQGGSWNRLAAEYEALDADLRALQQEVAEVRARRLDCYRQLRTLKQERVAAEVELGRHFRERVFEREPTEADMQERTRRLSQVEDLKDEINRTRLHIRALMHEQTEMVRRPEVLAIHERRRRIEIEAELKRLRLIRHAVISSRGLLRSGRRPSAWWFPMLCPDGLWFRETVESAECYLEPLI